MSRKIPGKIFRRPLSAFRRSSWRPFSQNSEDLITKVGKSLRRKNSPEARGALARLESDEEIRQALRDLEWTVQGHKPGFIDLPTLPLLVLIVSDVVEVGDKKSGSDWSVYTSDEAEGGYPNETRVKKVSWRPGEQHPVGAEGTVAGSIGLDGEYLYFVRWDDEPELPRLSIGVTIARLDEQVGMRFMKR